MQLRQGLACERRNAVVEDVVGGPISGLGQHTIGLGRRQHRPDRGKQGDGLVLIDHRRRWRLKVTSKTGGFEDQPRGSHAVKCRQRLPRLDDGVGSNARRR